MSQGKEVLALRFFIFAILFGSYPLRRAVHPLIF